VLETSGWTHSLPNPEVRDIHDYNQDPASFKKRWLDYFAGDGGVLVPARYGTGIATGDLGVPFMISEFGGIGWSTEGGWSYGSGPKTEEEFYARYQGLVDAQLDNPDLFGFCYTQLTDVEQEKNGLYYYDRRPKFDVKRLHDITARPAAYERTGPVTPLPPSEAAHHWHVLVGAAPDGDLCAPYHFTTNAPAAGWQSPAFNDRTWPEARAPFGTINNFRTQWTTPDIWLRRSFEWNGKDIASAALVILHDENTEVYVNGQAVWERGGYNTAYESFDVTGALKRALKPGKNTLAIHTRQTVGGQFIDLALLVESSREPQPLVGRR
jgi:hypothetical protein